MGETDCGILWNSSEEGGNVLKGIDCEGGDSKSDW